MIKVPVAKKGWTTLAYDQDTDVSITYIKKQNRYQLKVKGGDPKEFEITLTDDPYFVYIKRKNEPEKKPKEYIPEEWGQEEERRIPIRPTKDEQ